MQNAPVVDTDLETALKHAKAEYARTHPASRKIHEAAVSVLPGGNTRTGIFHQPFPIAFERGQDVRLWDEDKNEYRDFFGEATAGIFGHSNPIIRQAVTQRLDRGWSLGGHSALEVEMAELLVDRFPSVERVRFANSGTEANLFNIQISRLATNRDAVLAFDGCYHGGLFGFRGKANPLNVPFEIVVGNYNDVDETETLIDRYGDRLACIILEPMIGGGGCIPASSAFLHMLREKTREHGIILIFDEVMTSRLSAGGIQELTGIVPDLTSLGKYIGGGFPVGAFGGRADLLDRFDPRRNDALAHAGTFNNNVFTLSAGIAGLKNLYTKQAAQQLNSMGESLRADLNQLLTDEDVPMQFTGIGSMLCTHMQRGKIQSPRDAGRGNAKLRELFYFDMLEHGFYVGARNCTVTLALPHSQEDCEFFTRAVRDFVSRRRDFLN